MIERDPTFAKEVAVRDECCQGCGLTKNLQAHHIVPLSKGGDDTPDNGILLCAECHADKHPNVPRAIFLIKRAPFGAAVKSVRICDKSYEQADELRQRGYESLTNVMAVAIDRLYQAEMPKESSMFHIKSRVHKGDRSYTVHLHEQEADYGTDAGYVVSVTREALPPHTREVFATREDAEARFAELCGATQFSARGHTKHCGDWQPHAPHVTGYYDTVRWGKLETFCPGRQVEWLLQDYERGSAGIPGELKGYYLRRE